MHKIDHFLGDVLRWLCKLFLLSISCAVGRTERFIKRRLGVFSASCRSELHEIERPPDCPGTRVAEQVAPNENSLPHPFLDDNGINPVYQKDSVSGLLITLVSYLQALAFASCCTRRAGKHYTQTQTHKLVAQASIPFP